MRAVYFKVINRKTGELETLDTMPRLAEKYEVDKTAIWQAARRDSRFLRNYQIIRCTDEEVANYKSQMEKKSNE